MTDPKLLRVIAQEMVPQGRWIAVEIGPGIGTLTKELCSRAEWVYALEYDCDLEEASLEVLEDIPNITWVWGDALLYDLSGKTVKEKHPTHDLVLCGNLPYYITSQIMYTALVGRCHWSRMGFVVQEEVGHRMAASKDSSGFGRLSLWCQYRGRVRVVKRLPGGAFIPRPDVGSSLVTIDISREFPLSVPEEEFMDSLSRAAFSARRKTLLNGFSPLFRDKEKLSSIIASAGIDPNTRAQNLGVDGFVTLAKALFPYRPSSVCG